MAGQGRKKAAFEFVYFRDQPQHFVRDGQAYPQASLHAGRRGLIIRHTRKYTRFYPILRRRVQRLIVFQRLQLNGAARRV